MTTFSSREGKNWNSFEAEIVEENKENLEKIDRLISFINNSKPEEFVKNFENYFNMDSVLNYYCLMQLVQLTYLEEHLDTRIKLLDELYEYKN